MHLITFDCGDVPIYRTHVAVMHFLMAEERLGVPWLVVVLAQRRRAVAHLLVQGSPQSRSLRR